MSEPSHTRKRVLWLLATVAVVGLFVLVVATRDNGDTTAGDGSTPPDYAKALAGSPPRLAALHEQADELLPGGQEAFDERIAELKGIPVVVNVWASWCGPCLIEFPHFQDVSAKLGKRVAFLGVNSQDNEDAAATLLRDNPVPYPSYTDPDKEITLDLEVVHGLPGTAFYDAEGNRTLTKTGQYTSTEDLEADIRKYAIEGETG